MFKFRKIRRYIKGKFLMVKDCIFPPSKSEMENQRKKDVYNYLVNKGCTTQLGWVDCIGKPIVDKYKNSKIYLGRGVILVSESTYNVAGINHPVILSTMAENAEIILHDGVGVSGGSIVTSNRIEIGEQTMLGVNCNIWGTDFHSISSEERLNSQGGGYSQWTGRL